VLEVLDDPSLVLVVGLWVVKIAGVPLLVGQPVRPARFPTRRAPVVNCGSAWRQRGDQAQASSRGPGSARDQRQRSVSGDRVRVSPGISSSLLSASSRE
jgi:hypothetical protein